MKDANKIRIKKPRKGKFRSKIFYYPAAGALALSSLFSVKKPPPKPKHEKTATTLSVSAGSLAALRSGVSSLADAVRGESRPAGSVQQAREAALASVAPAPGMSDPVLQEAHRHLQVAKDHWEHGRMREAGFEADEVYRILANAPSSLDSQQDQIRNEMRLDLSRLVVNLNEAQAGEAVAQIKEPAQPLGPVNLEMNPRVEREIKLFQGHQRLTFTQGYQLAGAHMPYIEKALAEKGVPRELGWLPLIESGFKTQAQSQVKALGLWQFMPATGDQFGLDRTRWIDNRMDPEQATEAAATYLKYLYNTFGGDWNKALAAYNWGEGNLRKLIRRTGRSDDQVTFWDIASRLPEETARYVPRFQAVAHIAQDPARYGFEDLGDPHMPRRYEIVSTEKQMDMDYLAQAIGTDPKELAEMNPELLHRMTPPQKHELRVPAGKAEILMAQLDQIPEYKPQPRIVEQPVQVARHKAKAGKRRSSRSTFQTASSKFKRPKAKAKRQQVRAKGKRAVAVKSKKMQLPARKGKAVKAKKGKRA